MFTLRPEVSAPQERMGVGVVRGRKELGDMKELREIN